MMDAFLLLAPVLILLILALVRFVGCYSLPSDVHPILSSAEPGDQEIVLTWVDSGFFGYNVKRGTTHGGPYTKVGSTPQGTTTFADTGLDVSTQYFYVVTGNLSPDPGSDESYDSNELSAFPAVTVTFNNPGNPDDPLSGVYDGELDFGPPGVQPWFWQGAGTGTAIYLGPPGASGTVKGNFSFANMTPLGRRLLRIRVLADQVVSGHITISDVANPTIVQPVVAGSPPTFIDTMWQNSSETITIQSDIGWDIAIDTVVYEGPP